MTLLYIQYKNYYYSYQLHVHLVEPLVHRLCDKRLVHSLYAQYILTNPSSSAPKLRKIRICLD